LVFAGSVSLRGKSRAAKPLFCTDIFPEGYQIRVTDRRTCCG
jgi:hypothetical protein